jgi:RNA polymerase sigma-70 factor (ECF subfamily)
VTGERSRVMAEALQRDARRQYGSSRTLAPVESVGERRVVSVAVRRAQAGDRDALRFLYERYARDVQRHVRSVVRDDHEAEDVTQLVFVKLMTAIVEYDERAVPFFAWLARLSHNVAVDHRRTRYDAPVEVVFASERAADRDERAGLLLAALERLAGPQREVVLLRHVVGLTPAEIAARIGRTESAVHGLHHRGRQALQQELRRLEAGPATRAAR